jgi:hypothetical protein
MNEKLERMQRLQKLNGEILALYKALGRTQEHGHERRLLEVIGIMIEALINYLRGKEN